MTEGYFFGLMFLGFIWVVAGCFIGTTASGAVRDRLSVSRKQANVIAMVSGIFFPITIIVMTIWTVVFLKKELKKEKKKQDIKEQKRIEKEYNKITSEKYISKIEDIEEQIRNFQKENKELQ